MTPNKFEVTSEDSGQFVKITVPPNTDKQVAFVELKERIPLPSDWVALNVSAKLRVTNYLQGMEAWNGVRGFLSFYDEADEQVGSDVAAITLKEDAPEWVTLGRPQTELPSQSFPVVSIPGIDRAWIEREVTIPADWAGRRIVLDFERVAPDAKVFVNGTECGEVHWPGGSVDVTKAIRPGAQNLLRVLVIASGEEGEVQQYMDADRVIKSKAVFKQRGLIGDVVLLAMPAGPRLDGLFIKPSVTNNELAVDVELANLKAAGPAKLTASAVNTQTGETEKTWELEVALPAPNASGQAVPRDVKLPWENPKLWDFQQPNLYTLRVALDGDGVKDETT